MKLIVFSILLSAVLSASAASDKIGGGLGVEIGMGSTYGAGGADGIGAAVEYQIQIRPNLRITPFVGTG